MPMAPETEAEQQASAAVSMEVPKQIEACPSLVPQNPVLLSRASNRARLGISQVALLRELALLREQASQAAAAQRRCSLTASAATVDNTDQPGADEAADPTTKGLRTPPPRDMWRRDQIVNHPNAVSASPGAKCVHFQSQSDDRPAPESAQMKPTAVHSLARAAALAMKQQQPVTLTTGFQSNRSGDSHVHGTDRICGVGFVGQGPFWFGSAPQRGLLGGRANGSPASQCGKSATAAPDDRSGTHRGPAAATTAPVTAPEATAAPTTAWHDSFRRGDMPGNGASVVGQCLELLAKAVDAAADAAPPETELTAVRLETKEQRLQWRDFLIETVSKRCANSLYESYDVEAEPPGYAKPPLSARQAVASEGVSIPHAAPNRSSPQLPPTVVAPHGAGWSPLGAGVINRHNSPNSMASLGVLGLLGCGGLPPTTTQRGCADAIKGTSTWLPELDEEPEAGYDHRAIVLSGALAWL